VTAAWPLLALRIVLGGLLLGFAVYSGLAVWAARKWRREAPPARPEYTPAVTILKPVRGVDAEALENFASFCRLDYPPDRYQILFGALDADDPALALARRIQAEFPRHDISIVVAPAGAPRGNNRKVSNLLAMLPHAKHDLLVLCDSDMRARPDYLRRIAAPFATLPPASLEARRHGEVPGEGEARHTAQSKIQTPAPGGHPHPKSKMNAPVGLVTCPYRGVRPQSFAAALEALGIGADFIPSTLVSRAVEGVSFALGSTIAMPRPVLEQIGGFQPLLDELADDYRLGNSVSRAGYRIVLSDYVVDDVLGPERFTAMWSRRLRWARTVRSCRPSGYAGSCITHGLALGLLFLVSMGFSGMGWAVFGAVTFVRLLTALVIARVYTSDGAVVHLLPLLPLSDLFGATLYVASYLGRHVLWRGERFRLLAGGRLVRDE
jgi:ceramide glucosyltransferase